MVSIIVEGVGEDGTLDLLYFMPLVRRLLKAVCPECCLASHKSSSELPSIALAGIGMVSCALFDAHWSAHDLTLNNQLK